MASGRWAGSRERRPAVLVLAGLDPSGGAGLLADIEALAWTGARPLAIATALTVQGRLPRGPRGRGPAGGRTGVSRVDPVDPELIAAQVRAILTGAPPGAVKIGMVGSAGIVSSLGALLDLPALDGVPVVLDPVLRASGGGVPLLRDGGDEGPADLLAPLLERAALVTPNWPELGALSGREVADDGAAIDAARSLHLRAVLVKGGHRTGAPVDLLVQGARVDRFSGRRRPYDGPGTGCRLASAVAGLLARGLLIEKAIPEAKRLVERYLDGLPQEERSEPRGPVNQTLRRSRSAKKV